VADRASAQRRRPALVGLSEERARRPASQVLARVPWDGRKVDPERMSAARFLGALPG